jgi:hypothetical protein
MAFWEYPTLHRRLNHILDIIGQYLQHDCWDETLFPQYVGSERIVPMLLSQSTQRMTALSAT